jgi:anion-transporting  ArsA/GET3 family ATPase
MNAPKQMCLSELVQTKRAIICCGAGGVGKTTMSASLAVAAARLGRRVLVLTIDPSRRLAETLGVSRHPLEPIALSSERLRAAGIQPPGSLDAWMLDPKLVSDESVRRFAKDDGAVQSLLKNRIYLQATQMVTGLHEYTAVKALHRFITEGVYDLVVLDTPPSRNALDFLDAPSRFSGFFDSGVFKLFMPKTTGLFGRAAGRLVNRVLSGVFGEDFANEMSGFLGAFASLFGALNADFREIREFLTTDKVSFLLVTSPAEAALAEAHFFHDRIITLGYPFAGFILNRSSARVEKEFPRPAVLPDDATPALRSAIEKLKRLARIEHLQAESDRGVLASLGLRSGAHAFAVPLPDMPKGASDIATLSAIADLVLQERRSGR